MTVVGDGVIGLSAMLAAKRLGVERIVILDSTKTASTSAARSAPPSAALHPARRAVQSASYVSRAALGIGLSNRLGAVVSTVAFRLRRAG